MNSSFSVVLKSIRLLLRISVPPVSIIDFAWSFSVSDLIVLTLPLYLVVISISSIILLFMLSFGDYAVVLMKGSLRLNLLVLYASIWMVYMQSRSRLLIFFGKSIVELLKAKFSF